MGKKYFGRKIGENLKRSLKEVYIQNPQFFIRYTDYISINNIFQEWDAKIESGEKLSWRKIKKLDKVLKNYLYNCAVPDNKEEFDRNSIIHIELLKKFIDIVSELDIDKLKKLECFEAIFDNSMNVLFSEEKQFLYNNTAQGILIFLLNKVNNAPIVMDCISYFRQKYINQRTAFTQKDILKYEEMIIGNLSIQDIDMQKYEDKVSNFDRMSKEEFEDFIANLSKIKIVTGRIPEKYCDYILNQKFDNKSPLSEDINKYADFLKRTVEDKALHILEKEGINGYIVKHVKKIFDPILGPIRGTCDDLNRIITLVDNNLLTKNFYKNMCFINTIFHEIQHAIQDRDINEDKISPTLYEMKKEDIIQNGRPLFYKQNHINSQIEIDARIAGLTRSVKYLQQLNVPVYKIAGYLREDIYEFINKMKLKTEEYRIEHGKIKYDIFKPEYVDVLFQSILQNAPEFIYDLYPDFSLEFEEDGTRKGDIQILMEYEKTKVNIEEFKLEGYDEETIQSERDKGELQKYIITNNSKVSNEKVIEDMIFLATYKPTSHETEKIRDMILKEKLLPCLKQWKKYKCIMFKHKRTELSREEYKKQQVKKLEAAINALNNFAINNPDNDLSRIILEEIRDMPKINGVVLNEPLISIETINKIISEVTPKERMTASGIIKAMINKSKSKDKIDKN